MPNQPSQVTVHKICINLWHQLLTGSGTLSHTVTNSAPWMEETLWFLWIFLIHTSSKLIGRYGTAPIPPHNPNKRGYFLNIRHFFPAASLYKLRNNTRQQDKVLRHLPPSLRKRNKAKWIQSFYISQNQRTEWGKAKALSAELSVSGDNAESSGPCAPGIFDGGERNQPP